VESKAHPPIASQAEWLEARKALLADEKALTKEYDRVSAKRRRLPMVKVEKEYVFQGASDRKSLLELFGENMQVIVYHFMFDPTWDKGCMGCTGFVDALGDLSMLGERDTSFVLISRAPIEKLEKYRKERGWNWPWYSSGETDFNYDFGVTLDPAKDLTEYNYRQDNFEKSTEMPGTSVFFRMGDEVYHTYSCYARGGEALTDSYRLLDITPYGRQEDFEDSPEGWPQKPTYG
jgi:predicted dithiol-disulfide oxidoreductase (DUF899 family)